MAYEVTATRRRPQRFEDLVGQEFVAETFRNSIKSGKIAHAYLFSGPRGCGKTSTARILAKALNCKEGPTSSPCGKCQQCVEITKGSCTDVIEIDGASNTSVNDVRQIKDEVLFPPQSCRYKIYIIDEVHMLSTSAFNALLKTIEEPPPYVIFIFATTELQKVPATIKSRCQQFNFRLVPIEKVKNLLAQACAEINIKAEDDALYWIARESTGSVRDAYTLFDQVAAFSADEITYEKIRDKLGLLGIDRLNAIFEDCAKNRTKSALEKLDEFLQSGISIEQLIANSADYLRSFLLIKCGITNEALLGQAAERFSAEVLRAWSSVQIERAVSIFLQLYRDIRYSLSPRYELELAFSRLCWLNQYVSPAEVKVAIDKAKALLDCSNPAAKARINQAQAPRRDFSSRLGEPNSANQYQRQAQSSRYENYAPEGAYPPDFSAGGAAPPQQTENTQNARKAASPQEIRQAVLSALKVSEPTLVADLEKSGEWFFSGEENDTINAPFSQPYNRNRAASHKAIITRAIKEVSGKDLTFRVTEDVHASSKTADAGAASAQKISVFPAEDYAQKEDRRSAEPEEVKILRELFKGKVISFVPIPIDEANRIEKQSEMSKIEDEEESDSDSDDFAD